MAGLEEIWVGGQKLQVQRVGVPLTGRHHPEGPGRGLGAGPGLATADARLELRSWQTLCPGKGGLQGLGVPRPLCGYQSSTQSCAPQPPPRPSRLGSPMGPRDSASPSESAPFPLRSVGNGGQEAEGAEKVGAPGPSKMSSTCSPLHRPRRDRCQQPSPFRVGGGRPGPAELLGTGFRR